MERKWIVEDLWKENGTHEQLTLHTKAQK